MLGCNPHIQRKPFLIYQKIWFEDTFDRQSYRNRLNCKTRIKVLLKATLHCVRFASSWYRNYKYIRLRVILRWVHGKHTNYMNDRDNYFAIFDPYLDWERGNPITWQCPSHDFQIWAPAQDQMFSHWHFYHCKLLFLNALHYWLRGSLDKKSAKNWQK